MSESSYRNKVKLGISGRNTQFPVCLPAACERIIPQSLSLETYLAYIGMVEFDSSDDMHKRLKNTMQTVAYSMIAEDAGLDSWKDLQFLNVKTKRSLRYLLKSAIAQKSKVVLDIDGARTEQIKGTYDPLENDHAAGLISLDEDAERFRVRSSWTPKVLHGVVTVDQLWPHMIHQRDPYWAQFSFHDSNVMLIPSSE